MEILLLLHIFITIFLILIVLMQKNEGGSSLFASGGSSNNMFNARGMSNMITKTTWVLGFIFLSNCVFMAYLASSNVKESQNIVDTSLPLPQNETEENSNGALEDNTEE
ncbi:MAG: preprotein translocase subunit SecG [Holosporales bacterium]|jgi:preprotein translocase subunit SecG|nr:preprotein translocase subunit SecG [Holosporales bacterium]